MAPAVPQARCTLKVSISLFIFLQTSPTSPPLLNRILRHTIFFIPIFHVRADDYMIILKVKRG